MEHSLPRPLAQTVIITATHVKVMIVYMIQKSQKIGKMKKDQESKGDRWSEF